MIDEDLIPHSNQLNLYHSQDMINLRCRKEN